MTIREAKQEIKMYIEGADRTISNGEEYIRGWKSAMLVAFEILKRTEPKWIDVNERLPDEQKDYLVFIPGEFKNNIMVARFDFNHRTGWRGAQAHSAIEDVTHWMELPEEHKSDNIAH